MSERKYQPVSAPLVRAALVFALGCCGAPLLAQNTAFSIASGLTAAGVVALPAPALPDDPASVARPLDLRAAPMASASSVAALQSAPAGQAGAVPLTIDAAIATALKSNTQITLSLRQEDLVRGEVLSVFNVLLPNLRASGYLRAQEINLAALGFKPGAIKVNIPGFNSADIPQIVKVNTADAQVSLSQQADLPALYLFRAAGKAAEAANWTTLNVRGATVLTVGQLYLRALADAAQVRNAEALIRQDQVVLDHAQQAKQQGTGINLDVLRAQVELQNEQQALINAQNAEAKDKIQLNRAMGQDAGQALDLQDPVPFADFDADSSPEALGRYMAIAEVRRKDLRGLEAQLSVAEETARSLKYERLPVLSVSGYYGVLGQIGGLYHGVFTAEGRLNVPIFLEAELRGQREVAAAQERALRQQIQATRAQVEADIRSSLLDVQSSRELVRVARSNVDLATQALGDATDRFTAGVDDNLAVVRAQADLQGAQARVVEAEFQYNTAKLELARNVGVVESSYREYLGR